VCGLVGKYRKYGYKTIHVKYKTWLVLQQLRLQLGYRSMNGVLRHIIREWYEKCYKGGGEG